MKSASTAGGVFALLFAVSLATLGDLLGSFADPDDAFETFFSDGGNPRASSSDPCLWFSPGARWFGSRVRSPRHGTLGVCRSS